MKDLIFTKRTISSFVNWYRIGFVLEGYLECFSKVLLRRYKFGCGVDNFNFSCNVSKKAGFSVLWGWPLVMHVHLVLSSYRRTCMLKFSYGIYHGSNPVLDCLLDGFLTSLALGFMSFLLYPKHSLKN